MGAGRSRAAAGNKLLQKKTKVGREFVRVGEVFEVACCSASLSAVADRGSRKKRSKNSKFETGALALGHH